MTYSTLASHYDDFTEDVNYRKWANYYERIWTHAKKVPKTVLDLACGTGSLTVELAKRGYDMTAVDLSEEMLMVAREKCQGLDPAPLLLHQPMEKLDLNDTVDAVVCALDSINYIISAPKLARTFRRVSLFLNKGGLFIFDVDTEAKFFWLDGQAFVRESEDAMCIWQASYSGATRNLHIDMDIFEERGGLWERFCESHTQHLWTTDELRDMLSAAGLSVRNIYRELKTSPPDADTHRIFFVCEKR